MNQLLQSDAHKKYDKSLEDKISMYDNEKYKKDPDLCSQDKIKLVSGNLIKYYTFQYNNSQPYVIETNDELMKEKIAHRQHELNERAAKKKKSQENISAEATADSDTE